MQKLKSPSSAVSYPPAPSQNLYEKTNSSNDNVICIKIKSHYNALFEIQVEKKSVVFARNNIGI
jgi:hypothetical protein